jgi:hypothetical protein
MDKFNFINFVARLRRINKFVDDLFELGINITDGRFLEDVYYCTDEVIECTFDVKGRDVFFEWFYEDLDEVEENGTVYNFTEDPATVWEYLKNHLV